jgi:hypothetical protein
MDISEFYKRLPVVAICDPIRFGYLDGYILAAPESFWDFAGQDMSAAVNGCGPGGIGDSLVPDTVYLLSIKAACKIHDWMYTIYNDEFGFELANQIFLDNMIRINNAATKNRLLKYLRSRRILKYYLAVRYFGRLFFYDAHIDLYQDQTVYA